MARRYGFGDPGSDAIAGPLIGGGVATVGALAARMLFAGKPAAKWSGLIGTLVGAGVVGALSAFSPRFKGTLIPGLITAAFVGVPRQLEEMLVDAGVLKDGYLGVVTPEQIAGYGGFGDDYSMGQSAVQLLDSGSGSTGVLGVHVPEQINGFGDDNVAGPGDGVELLGGFGSNFLSAA
jgi:hypothetical protein